MRCEICGNEVQFPMYQKIESDRFWPYCPFCFTPLPRHDVEYKKLENCRLVEHDGIKHVVINIKEKSQFIEKGEENE